MERISVTFRRLASGCILGHSLKYERMSCGHNARMSARSVCYLLRETGFLFDIFVKI